MKIVGSRPFSRMYSPPLPLRFPRKWKSRVCRSNFPLSANRGWRPSFFFPSFSFLILPPPPTAAQKAIFDFIWNGLIGKRDGVIFDGGKSRIDDGWMTGFLCCVWERREMTLILCDTFCHVYRGERARLLNFYTFIRKNCWWRCAVFEWVVLYDVYNPPCSFSFQKKRRTIFIFIAIDSYACVCMISYAYIVYMGGGGNGLIDDHFSFVAFVVVGVCLCIWS